MVWSICVTRSCRQLSPLYKEDDNNLKCAVTVTVMYFRPEGLRDALGKNDKSARFSVLL